MVSSADIFKKDDFEAAEERDYLYKAIELDPNIHNFRYKFYSRNLNSVYKASVKDQEAYTETFNDVSVTVLRPSRSFMFNGLAEMTILEHDQNVIVLSGEIMKRNMSSPMKFFDLSDDDPQQNIQIIFSKLADAYHQLEQSHPNEYDRRDHIISRMKPILDVDTLYNQKIDPLVLK